MGTTLTIDELDGHTTGLIALAGRDLLGFQKYGVGGLIDPLVGVFGPITFEMGVLTDISKAPMAGDSRIPQFARIPAASGIATAKNLRIPMIIGS